MGVVAQGEVIRFDQIKGYGFIAPRNGGEDVFLHVNDLLDDKHLMRPGAVVEFLLEPGDRGPKASSVHLVKAAAPGYGATPPAGISGFGRTDVVRDPSPASAPVARPDGTDSDDELVEVLSPADFTREVTELLLRIEPPLHGPQILAVRDALLAVGGRYGWIGN